MALMRRGAEAELRREPWLGYDAVWKVRVPKGYRHGDLDRAIRTSRTRREARFLARAGVAGVTTPLVFAAWPDEATLVMEHLSGLRLKEAVPLLTKDRLAGAFEALGTVVARLHSAGIVHGDLTTSNAILLPPGPRLPPRRADDEESGGAFPVDSNEPVDAEHVALIDFGLAEESDAVEDQGTDLHCLREAIESTHYDVAGLFEAVARGYDAARGPGSKEVLRRVDEIDQRGRYA